MTRDGLRRREALAAIGAAPFLLAAEARAVAKSGVRREDHVPVDGAHLYLLVRGERSGTPVLLWLHGGPGGAERPLFQLYDSGLERRFTVAYLDQRGAGRSYDPDADPARLTVARHLADLDVVVDHLRRTLKVATVILVGHSWGSALGLLYLKAHPEKVAAFAGTGQVISTLAGQRAQADFVAAEARRRGDASGAAVLAAAGPPPWTAARTLDVERVLNRYGGEFHRRPNRMAAMIRALAHGYVTPTEIPRIIRANNASLVAMNAELASLDLSRQVRAVAAPVIFMLGRYDRVTDSRLAAAYFERLAAPRKRLLWFEHSAHNPPFEEPMAFGEGLAGALREVGAIDGAR